jgi:hypothetical protein
MGQSLLRGISSRPKKCQPGLCLSEIVSRRKLANESGYPDAPSRAEYLPSVSAVWRASVFCKTIVSLAFMAQIAPAIWGWGLDCGKARVCPCWRAAKRHTLPEKRGQRGKLWVLPEPRPIRCY